MATKNEKMMMEAIAKKAIYEMAAAGVPWAAFVVMNGIKIDPIETT